jgi:hypothetical protein
MIKLPGAFLKMTAFFHQDIGVLYPTGEEIVEGALAQLTPQERDSVKHYVDELLSGRYDEAQLREIWRNTRAEISPFRGDDGNCGEFLKYIRSFLTN